MLCYCSGEGCSALACWTPRGPGSSC